MKIRFNFVSNSSSSSCIVIITEDVDYDTFIEDLNRAGGELSRLIKFSQGKYKGAEVAISGLEIDAEGASLITLSDFSDDEVLKLLKVINKLIKKEVIDKECFSIYPIVYSSEFSAKIQEEMLGNTVISMDISYSSIDRNFDETVESLNWVYGSKHTGIPEED